MSPPTKSSIWTYFILDKSNPERSECKLCNKSYSRKGRTTTSLKNHLKSMHPKEYSVLESTNNENQLKKIKDNSDKSVTPFEKDKRRRKEKKWDVNNSNSKKIDRLIGEMLALQNLPFDFVEGLGFRRLIEELAPKYNLKGRIKFLINSNDD